MKRYEGKPGLCVTCYGGKPRVSNLPLAAQAIAFLHARGCIARLQEALGLTRTRIGVLTSETPTRRMEIASCVKFDVPKRVKGDKADLLYGDFDAVGFRWPHE